MDWSEHFYYDETSPSGLRWARDVFSGRGYKFKAKSVGDIAGCLSEGYWTVSLLSKGLRVHRIIYELLSNKSCKDFQIDHINGSGSDNNIQNLRLVTNKINARNQKQHTRNTTGHTGVCLYTDKMKWVAGYVNLNGSYSRKGFYISKHGLLPAFAMACKWREDKIKELNEQGAGYTERHGTNE